MSLAILNNPNLQFGGLTFFARPHESDTCGTNGLPLTPNSITIYGKAQMLKAIDHPNLCRYLDVIRSKHGKSTGLLYLRTRVAFLIHKFKMHEEQ